MFSEIYVTDFHTLVQAIQAGAKKILLGAGNLEQAVTVSKGFIAEASKYAHEHQASVTLIIKAKAQGYVYSDIEAKMMEADIFEAQALGVDAVAIGALTDAGRLDLDLMEQLSASAGGMQVVANFAVDEIQADAQTEACTWLADHDFDKVMTTNASALATSDLFYLEVSEQRLTEALSGKTAVITTKI